MEKKIYSFSFGEGSRGYHVDGMFVSTVEEMQRLFGGEDGAFVDFGECRGKHSQVTFEDVKFPADFTEVPSTPEIVAWFETNVGHTGMDPRHRVKVYCDECGYRMRREDFCEHLEAKAEAEGPPSGVQKSHD